MNETKPEQIIIRDSEIRLMAINNLSMAIKSLAGALCNPVQVSLSHCNFTASDGPGLTVSTEWKQETTDLLEENRKEPK